MEMENVTNGMLYDLIRDFKDDVNRRFAEVDKRFEQITAEVNARFEQVHEEIRGLKEMIREDRSKLNEVYESRNKVTVTFSRAFSGINLVLSALVSAFVSLLVSR